jgi:hypothetical protein
METDSQPEHFSGAHARACIAGDIDPECACETRNPMRTHSYLFDSTCSECVRKRACEDAMFTFHAATGGDAPCTCGYHVKERCS